MTVDEIADRTTVEFPKTISRSRAEELLRYLASELPANINYNISQFVSLGHPFGTNSNEVARISRTNGSVSIHGSISKPEKPFPFDSFEFDTSGEDPRELCAMHFTRVSGWYLSD